MQVTKGLTKIDWADRTLQLTTGCNQISQGCKHCYAKVMHARQHGIYLQSCGTKSKIYSEPFSKVVCYPEQLKKIATWKTPSRAFINSMSDTFHDDVPRDFQNLMFKEFAKYQQHVFMLLTKRADNMYDYFSTCEFFDTSNIFLGVSVENRKAYEERVYQLGAIKAGLELRNTTNKNVAHTFLSIEPLLEDLGVIDLAGIGWVIVGGESGLGARKMEKDWVLKILKQCKEQGVPFFFKQWGNWGENGEKQRSKKHTGRSIDGIEYNEMPEILKRYNEE